MSKKISKKTLSIFLSIVVGLFIGLGLLGLSLLFIGKEVLGQTQIRTIEIGANLKMKTDTQIDMNSQPLIKLIMPSGPADAATRDYIDKQDGLGTWRISGDIISRSGNVGIGTINPQAKLHIKTGYICSGTELSCESFNIESTCKAQKGCSWGSLSCDTFSFYLECKRAGCYWDQEMLRCLGTYLGCSGEATPCSAIADQSTCQAQQGCSWTSGGPAVAGIFEGRVGVGVTNPSFRLDLPNVAGVDGRGRANQWTIYSSIRWKENIVPIVDALKKLVQVQGVYFNWKPEYGGTKGIGLIAEDVGKIIPEVVEYEEDGIYAKSLDYDHLVALVIEAIKEQQKEIEQLRQEIQELKAIINK